MDWIFVRRLEIRARCDLTVSVKDGGDSTPIRRFISFPVALSDGAEIEMEPWDAPRKPQKVILRLADPAHVHLDFGIEWAETPEAAAVTIARYEGAGWSIVRSVPARDKKPA
jgi:hypothetical protein